MKSDAKLKIAFFAVLLVLVLLHWKVQRLGKPDYYSGLDIGAAPDPFQLHDYDGKIYDLGDYLGNQPLIIAFGSLQDRALNDFLGQIERVNSETQNIDLAIFLIEIALDRTMPEVEKSRLLSYPVLFDEEQNVLRAFRIRTVPMIFGIDESGRVACKWTNEIPALDTQFWQAVNRLKETVDK